MECGVFRAHLVVVRRAVLQVVAVAVLHEPLPFGRHFGGSLHEVEFRPQVVRVVGGVNALHVLQEAFERLSVAVLIQQGGERLVQLMERLHA